MHTVKSQFLGYDANGHPQFDTTRSEVGEALYKCKYLGDKKACYAVADAAVDFLQKQNIKADVIIAIPPSKTRSVQPLSTIASRLASQLGLEYDSTSVVKTKTTPELKSLEDFEERQKALKGAFRINGKKLNGKRVLLLDDLYRSGASMVEVANTLLTQGGVNSVIALALTRTRSRT